MKAYLLDTHTWAYALLRSAKLSMVAQLAMSEAEATWISPASFYEITQKTRLGKWPEMAPLVGDLISAVQLQHAEIAPLDPAVCLKAGAMDWSHRDPFDRMLAATALVYRLPIVSADTVFDGIVTRVW